jgi:hypothetical protein
MALHHYPFLPQAGSFPICSVAWDVNAWLHMGSLTVGEQQARPTATINELYQQELLAYAHSRAYRNVRGALDGTPDGSTGLGNMGSICVDRPDPSFPSLASWYIANLFHVYTKLDS